MTIMCLNDPVAPLDMGSPTVILKHHPGCFLGSYIRFLIFSDILIKDYF